MAAWCSDTDAFKVIPLKLNLHLDFCQPIGCLSYRNLTGGLHTRLGAAAPCLYATIVFIIWLAPRAGKMKRIRCSGWLPKRPRWAYRYLAGLRLPEWAKFFGVICGHKIMINNLLTKFVRSRWLDFRLVIFFCGLSNIQPS